jgi:hypothetical protein
MKVCFLKLKSKALSALKDYEMELRCQTPGAKIRKLCSDRGGEYLSMEFDRHLGQKITVSKIGSLSITHLSRMVSQSISTTCWSSMPEPCY